MSRAVTREDDRLNAVEYAAVDLRDPQEAVKHIARINVGSGDRAGTYIDSRDRKSTRLNSSHSGESRMPSSA